MLRTLCSKYPPTTWRYRRAFHYCGIPSKHFWIGGKIEANENPYLSAKREVPEEAGITIKNMRLEAIILEIIPHKKVMPYNWLIFHFSADYESGNIQTTDEGELVLLTLEKIVKQKLFPSVREIIHHILNPHDGAVFATFKYDDNGNIAEKTMDVCAM